MKKELIVVEAIFMKPITYR